MSYVCAAGGWRESTSARDLSLGGIFVETPTMLPVGSLVALEIESAGTKAALDGRVLSCREKAEGPGAPAGFAVLFIDLPLEVQSALHIMIAARAPRRGTTLGLGSPEEGIKEYDSERSIRSEEGGALRPVSEPELPVTAQRPAATPAAGSAAVASAPASASAPAPASASASASAPAPASAPASASASASALAAALSSPPAASRISVPPRRSRARLVVVVVTAVIVVASIAVLSTR